MNTSSQYPKRKRLRLQNYDYSTQGAYFVTICTSKHRSLFRNVGAHCVRPSDAPLSSIGMVVEREIQKISTIYDHVWVDKYCIMPDHLHMIIFIMSDGCGRTQFAPMIPRIIKQFKGSITKQLGFSVWQKSYIDRVIRNEKAYQEIWTYIDNNPLKLNEENKDWF